MISIKKCLRALTLRVDGAIDYGTYSFNGGDFTAEQYRSDINYTIPSKTGYHPYLLGINVQTHTRMLIVNSGLNGLNLNLRVRSLYTTAQTDVNFQVRILWVKNELIKD